MLYMDFVLRVALSMVLGFLIGLERQLTGHPAGIRINVLICMGTSFFTLFPMLYGSDQVFRVGSSIISGVGFLCSGVIFKDSGSVRGMNTAATLWCTAAIGILASTRMYAMAVTAAVLLIGSNLILRPLARKVNPIAAGEENEKQYRISVTCQESAEQELRALLIHSNTCKTLYLTNLESGDVVGDKVEILAEYCSSGKSKRTVLEGIVGQALKAAGSGQRRLGGVVMEDGSQCSTSERRKQLWTTPASFSAFSLPLAALCSPQETDTLICLHGEICPRKKKRRLLSFRFAATLERSLR